MGSRAQPKMGSRAQPKMGSRAQPKMSPRAMQLAAAKRRGSALKSMNSLKSTPARKKTIKPTSSPKAMSRTMGNVIKNTRNVRGRALTRGKRK
tara:strand:+ start:1072 stop:1350 length:279 start_codon:yes stop_codon:yes gene_type:complete